MTEDQLEQEALGWLTDVGYTHLYGPDIAFDGSCSDRAICLQVVLPFRLREAINRLNPDIPIATLRGTLLPRLIFGQLRLTQSNPCAASGTLC